MWRFLQYSCYASLKYNILYSEYILYVATQSHLNKNKFY